MTSAEYIRELFDPADRIAIVLISRSEEKYVIQKIMSASMAMKDGPQPDGSKTVQSWLRYMNSPETDPTKDSNGRPFDVYVGMHALKPGARGRTKDDVAAVRHVMIEIDEDGPAAVKRILQQPALEQPNFVVTSSPGRYHLIWSVKDFDQEKLETLAGNMTRQFGGDPSAVVGASAVSRLPFRNHKHPDIMHYVTIETRSRAVVGPEAFPRELFAADREWELAHAKGHTKGGAEDWFKEDAARACKELRAGGDPAMVAMDIDQRRKSAGRALHKRDYGRKTVAWALKQPDVVKARQRLEHTPGRG